jgi:hypothetical protein
MKIYILIEDNGLDFDHVTYILGVFATAKLAEEEASKTGLSPVSERKPNERYCFVEAHDVIGA